MELNSFSEPGLFLDQFFFLQIQNSFLIILGHHISDFYQTPVLGLELGFDFTFAWDNKNKNEKNPHQNFLKGTVLEVKEIGLGIKDKGQGIRHKG